MNPVSNQSIYYNTLPKLLSDPSVVAVAHKPKMSGKKLSTKKDDVPVFLQKVRILFMALQLHARCYYPPPQPLLMLLHRVRRGAAFRQRLLAPGAVIVSSAAVPLFDTSRSHAPFSPCSTPTDLSHDRRM